MNCIPRNTLLVAIVLMMMAACSRGGDKTVATVGGEKITAAMLKEEMKMERGKYDPAFLTSGPNFTEFKRRALEVLIQKAILTAEAKRVGIKLSSDDVKEIEKMRTGINSGKISNEDIAARGINPEAWEDAQKRRILITRLIQTEVVEKIPVPEEKIAAHYKKHGKEFNQPEHFHARQILTDGKEAAENVLVKLKQGEDFAELAKQYSQSPDAKNGGDLGFFDSGAYPPVFSEVCRKLKEGEVSGVIATDYGYQIFELIEKRPARKIPFDEAKEDIRRMFREEEALGAIEKWNAELEKNAKIEIDDKAIEEVKLADVK